MPKLWTATVETHRQEVREAILAAAGDLVNQRGLLALTMSEVATAAGIGRATLYKYFSDVEEVLRAWHHQQVTAHLTELTALRDQSGPAADKLRAVLKAYGHIAQQRGHAGDQLTEVLHRDGHISHAEGLLHNLVTGLISEAADAAIVRSDVPAAELTDYCLHALAAARQTNAAGLGRLLDVVWSGLTGPAPPCATSSGADFGSEETPETGGDPAFTTTASR